MSRHRRRAREAALASEGEINLVPYMDIMVNLVLFLLVTFSVATDFRGIPFDPPSCCGTAGEVPTQLTLTITNAGFTLLTNGVGAAGTEFVALADGKYDHDALTARIARIKRDVPGLSDVLIVVAEPEITTETLVGAMDAAREGPSPDDPSKTVALFSKVSFARPGSP